MVLFKKPRTILLSSLLALSAALPVVSHAQATFDGYMCCNVWPTEVDPSWISDINYRPANLVNLTGSRKEERNAILPGDKVQVTGYGRFRAKIIVNGDRKYGFGNDYSRNISDEELIKRWVWTVNPKEKIAKAAPKVQQAINEGKLTLGMTPEEVAMSVGYPVASENKDLDIRNVPMWRFWLSSFEEYAVFFENGVVKEVKGDPGVIYKIMLK